MPQQVHYLNGTFVNENELVISARDLGFTRGYVVFEYLRTYENHIPFMLSKHIDRLFTSAQLIGLDIPWNKDQIVLWVKEALNKNSNETGEKTVGITISGGPSKTMIPTGTPTIIIIIDPCPVFPKELYEKGTSLITVQYNNYNQEAKTNNYIEGVKHAQNAKNAGAIEPLYFDTNQVYECSKSSIFAIINNQLVTPRSHVLKGITREILLQELKLNIPVLEQDFTLKELLGAQEIFITASVKEIVPVVKIDETIISDGNIGVITKEIMKQYKEFIENKKWVI